MGATGDDRNFVLQTHDLPSFCLGHERAYPFRIGVCYPPFGGTIEGQMAGWTDQVAIVTGSSRGIGRAIARALGWSRTQRGGILDANAQYGERTMVGRTGRPHDIANAAGFLPSPGSGFVTAQVTTVDGRRWTHRAWLKGGGFTARRISALDASTLRPTRGDSEGYNR